MKGVFTEFMKIKVLSKKVITTDTKGKENVFYRYFTPVKICVIRKHEDGTAPEDMGIQEKSLRVHFTKTAMKKLDDEKVFAILTIEKGENIQLPFVYTIIQKSDGTIEYPEDKNDAWVRDFDKLEEIPYTPKENTCVPILDEKETEPVEIVEEN